MADNFVTVQAQWAASTPTGGNTFSNGNFEFVAAGLLMRSSAVAIVYPIVLGQLDSLGALSVPTGNPGSVGIGAPNSGVALLASDNFAAGELAYDIVIRVQGVPDIHAQDVPVNFALGATQGLFTILQAAGWTPDTF